MTAWAVMRETIGQRRRTWLALTLGLTCIYHLGLVASASISTGHLPNYIRFYDWPADVLRIIETTPSMFDMPSIINDEWLIELGGMNYHYGHGIAEWSLAIIPSHVLITLLLSALVATNVLLYRRSRTMCPLAERGAGATATGLGAVFVGTANITMTWVACCSTPSWVVGLSLLGVESSSAFVLLPYGNALTGTGFAILALSTCWLAWRCTPRPPRLAIATQPILLDR
ncbi:MAG TPA: hypothetical protein VGG57_15550 [Stellaceae bacterium]